MSLARSQHDSRHDLVLPPRQPVQHPYRVIPAFRLFKDISVEDDDRIGGNDQLIGFHVREVGFRFLASDEAGDFFRRETGGMRLVDIGYQAHLKIEVQSFQQLPSSR